MNPCWIEPDWPAPPGVRALSTWRDGGVSHSPFESLNLGDHVGDEVSAVLENRRRLSAAARLPAEPHWLAQVHGIEVLDLDEAKRKAAPAPDERSAAPVADAAFTRESTRICAILTADCLPVLFATESGDAVAAAHAGWRGLANGVLEATVRALAVPPGTLMAWLGPAIGPDHFEVGSEVREALLGDSGLSADSGAIAAFQPNSRGRWMANLPMLARRRLAVLGVARIYGGGECTYSRPDRYFSHRRDGNTGRQATLIWRGPR